MPEVQQPAPTRFPRGILVSCVVPWDDREQLLEGKFRDEIRRMRSHGFSQLYIFGTAGEGYAVDTARFRDVAAVFREETREAGVLAQVGVIALSTANYVERIAIAHDVGFRVFQVSLPCWGVLNDNELLSFFGDVCGTFPDSRFLHYNLLRAGRILRGQDYRRLADAVPNLAATKITGSDRELAREVITLAPELQHFFVRSFAEASEFGPCSLLGVWAPMCPTRTRLLFKHACEGNLPALRRLHAEMLSMDGAVLGPARTRPLMDGAFDKLRVRLGGVRDFPLRLLSPYETFTEEIALECERILHDQFPGWVG